MTEQHDSGAPHVRENLNRGEFTRIALRDMIINYGVARRFEGEPPRDLSMREYRYAVEGLGCLDNRNRQSLDKGSLFSLANELGDLYHKDPSEYTCAELRRKISKECGFVYTNSVGRSDTFRERELAEIAYTLAERIYEETGSRVTPVVDKQEDLDNGGFLSGLLG